jgi:hypothetical protein
VGTGSPRDQMGDRAPEQTALRSGSMALVLVATLVLAYLSIGFAISSAINANSALTKAVLILVGFSGPIVAVIVWVRSRRRFGKRSAIVRGLLLGCGVMVIVVPVLILGT